MAIELQGLRKFYSFRGVGESKDERQTRSDNSLSWLVPTLYRKQQSLVDTVERCICLFDGLANFPSRPRERLYPSPPGFC